MPVQDNRPAVYLEGNNVIYRASALGGCIRALWAARTGHERTAIPQVVKRGMDEGTDLEPVILNLLFEKYNWTFADGSQSVLEMNVGAFNGKTLWVRGAVDEIGCPADPMVVGNSMQKHKPVDVKAFTNDDVEKYRDKGFAAFPRYAWQQSFYGLAYGTDSFYMPVFNKGTWAMEEWTLAPHGILFTRDQIAARVLEVEEHAMNGTMPDKCDGNFACVYPYLHDQPAEKDTIPEAALPLARTSIILRQKIKVFTDAQKKLDEAIKPHLASDGETTYTLDDWSIKHFANPGRFNTDHAKSLLREAGFDLDSEEFKIPGNGTQVRFTPPKEPKA